MPPLAIPYDPGARALRGIPPRRDHEAKAAKAPPRGGRYKVHFVVVGLTAACREPQACLYSGDLEAVTCAACREYARTHGAHPAPAPGPLDKVRLTLEIPREQIKVIARLANLQGRPWREHLKRVLEEQVRTWKAVPLCE